jgi:hypothetical protein
MGKTFGVLVERGLRVLRGLEIRACDCVSLFFGRLAILILLPCRSPCGAAFFRSLIPAACFLCRGRVVGCGRLLVCGRWKKRTGDAVPVGIEVVRVSGIFVEDSLRLFLRFKVLAIEVIGLLRKPR